MVVLNLLSWIPLVGFAIPKTTIQNRNSVFRVYQNRQVSVVSLLHQSSFGIQQDVEQRHRSYVSESTNQDNHSQIIQIPKFVNKVTDWLDGIPIMYTLQCQPLSSIIVNPNDSRYISTSISQQQQQQHEQLLYMVQIVIPTEEPQNEENNSDVSSSSSSSSSTSSVLILHLISSPTSIHDYIPPGITRSMTENPYQLQFLTTMHHNNDYNNTIHNNNNISQQIQIIHLHEDIWDNQRTNHIVKARILCRLRTVLLSLNNQSSNNQNTYNYRRLYARQTYVQRIDRIVATKFLNQHHLWGTTHSFKYAYGLYQKQPKNNNNNQNDNQNGTNHNNTMSTTSKQSSLDDEMLVAVATFSGKRNVRRGQEQSIYRSYELLRVCTCCDTIVIGSISKLVSAFMKEYNVDDIVTVIDRDWGIGQSNWYTLGFTTVTIMAPIPMVIHSQSGLRHHLIGAGISHNTDPINTNSSIDQPNHDRLGLPSNIINELESITSYDVAVQCLDRHGYYLVYDVGVERLVHFVSKQPKSKVLQLQSNDNDNNNNVQFDVTATTIDLWNNSTPQYATQHYSNIAGINALIQKQN